MEILKTVNFGKDTQIPQERNRSLCYNISNYVKKKLS